MKKYLKIFLCLLFVFQFLFSYADQKKESIPLEYQAVVRDLDGFVRRNLSLKIRFVLYENNKVYEEQHDVLSNHYGMISVYIGKGEILYGNYHDLNWRKLRALEIFYNDTLFDYVSPLPAAAISNYSLRTEWASKSDSALFAWESLRLKNRYFDDNATDSLSVLSAAKIYELIESIEMPDAFSGDYAELYNIPNIYDSIQPIRDSLNLKASLLHSHDLPEHFHDLPEHFHDLPEHFHDLPEHSHDLPEHSHDLPEHFHDLPEHSHKTFEIEGLSDSLNDIKRNIETKVDKVQGKNLSTEDYTAHEKYKLFGIAENANLYIHPSSHEAAIIVQNAQARFVSDKEKTQWNAKLDSIPYASKTTELKKGIDGVVGISKEVARADHNHTLPPYPDAPPIGSLLYMAKGYFPDTNVYRLCDGSAMDIQKYPWVQDSMILYNQNIPITGVARSPIFFLPLSLPNLFLMDAVGISKKGYLCGKSINGNATQSISLGLSSSEMFTGMAVDVANGNHYFGAVTDRNRILFGLQFLTGYPGYIDIRFMGMLPLAINAPPYSIAIKDSMAMIGSARGFLYIVDLSNLQRPILRYTIRPSVLDAFPIGKIELRKQRVFKKFDGFLLSGRNRIFGFQSPPIPANSFAYNTAYMSSSLQEISNPYFAEKDILDFAVSENLMIVADSDGRISVSSDTKEWSPPFFLFGDARFKVGKLAYSKGLWVAGSSEIDGSIAYSKDGYQWQYAQTTLPASSSGGAVFSIAFIQTLNGQNIVVGHQSNSGKASYYKYKANLPKIEQDINTNVYIRVKE